MKEWQINDGNGNITKENTIMVLKILINSKKPELMPRGIDKFRLFNRLGKAFENSEKNNFLELEDGDYLFLKKTIEDEIVGNWGMNNDRAIAIELFLNPTDKKV